MGKLRTVTVVYDEGDMVITGYYSRAYAGTSETPPEPSMFEVTDAFFRKDARTTDIGHVPRELLAGGAWDTLGELARHAVEELERSEREAHAERKE